jgi:multiple sugar transport system ATP-binding protein
MAEVRLDGVTRRFNKTVAVEDLSLTIGDGEFIVLLGPTGAGKTTTLRLVAGLERPDAGSVHIGGRDVTAEPPAARDVTFVFQQYSLYPHLSVFDNLAFPLRSPTRRTPEPEIERKVREVARLLQIEEKLGNRATQLSGGQMQRVAIGRALVRRPSVYLMDEPLSSLDAKLRAELRLELKRVQMDLGATILYVTHDQIEAMTLATRIGVVDRGRLVQVGTPRQIYESPVDTYVAQRLGQPAINLVPADLLPANRLLPGTATVGARTEHIRVTPANGTARGKVKWVEHLGDQSHLHVSVGGSTIVALVDPDTPLGRDDAVDIALVDPLCFDAAGRRIA